MAISALPSALRLAGSSIKSSSVVGKFQHFSLKSPLSLKRRCCLCAAAAPDTIIVHFQSANITVNGKAGDNIYDLAERSGVTTITAGCCSGNCGICEVEVRKYDDDADASDDAAVAVVRSCVTPLPPGYVRIEINELIDDVWGLDGYDT